MSIYIEDIINKAESGDEKAQFDLALAYCIFFMYRRLLSGKIYGTKKFFEP